MYPTKYVLLLELELETNSTRLYNVYLLVIPRRFYHTYEIEVYYITLHTIHNVSTPHPSPLNPQPSTLTPQFSPLLIPLPPYPSILIEG